MIKAAVICALMASPLGCAPLQQKDQIEAHSRQAQQYLQEKRPDLAIGEFQAILAIDPNNLDARGNLGVLEYFQGQYSKAVPDLRAALSADPSLWKLEALLGMSEKRNGENTRAEADLEKAFPQFPNYKSRSYVCGRGWSLLRSNTRSASWIKPRKL